MLSFRYGGDAYAIAQRGVADPDLEPLSSQEAAGMVRMLLSTETTEIRRELARFFGSAEALLRELGHHASWTDGGTCQVEFFRRPRNLRIGVPPVRPPIDLDDLVPDDAREVEHWIEVELQDNVGGPVRQFPLELELPSGGRVTSRTNLFGFVRIDGILRDGTATVYLPELDPDDRPTPPVEERSALRFELVDDNGPRAGLELIVTLPDGAERTVTTDAQGLVELPDVLAGNCTIRTEPAPL